MGKAIASHKSGGIIVATADTTGYGNTLVHAVKSRIRTKDNNTTNKLVRQGKLPKSQAEIYPQFSPQQVRAIKQSPKGELPKFMSSYSLATPKRSGTR